MEHAELYFKIGAAWATLVWSYLAWTKPGRVLATPWRNLAGWVGSAVMWPFEVIAVISGCF